MLASFMSSASCEIERSYVESSRAECVTGQHYIPWYVRALLRHLDQPSLLHTARGVGLAVRTVLVHLARRAVHAGGLAAPAFNPLCLMQVAEGLTGKTSTGEDLRVREVWQDNLDSELEIIRDIVDDYPYIAMDTEFPGVVARPVGNFKNSGEYHFQTLR